MLAVTTTILAEALQDQQYTVEPLRITTLMREVPTGITIQDNPYIDSIRSRISYANKVRELLERNDAMAILAISAIRELRTGRGNEAETPLANQAYIIRQFKRPEEIKLSEAFTVSTDEAQAGVNGRAAP